MTAGMLYGEEEVEDMTQNASRGICSKSAAATFQASVLLWQVMKNGSGLQGEPHVVCQLHSRPGAVARGDRPDRRPGAPRVRGLVVRALPGARAPSGRV